MSEMSRAMRETIQAHAPTLKELKRDVLNDFVEIVHAFAADLRAEQLRRIQAGAEDPAQPPSRAEASA